MSSDPAVLTQQQATQLMAVRQAARELAADRLLIAQARQAAQHAKSRPIRSTPLQIGDWVTASIVRNKLSLADKLAPLYEGPFQILDVAGSSAMVQLSDGTTLLYPQHRLRKLPQVPVPTQK